MKVDLTITITLLCITLLHFGQDVNCSSDASPDGGEDRLKRYPSDQDLAFLQKSIKRQGDGDVDMLRNLAISRLVKRSLKRAPYQGGRRMAISRLIKKNYENEMKRLPYNEYDIEDLLTDAYPDTFLPQRSVKDAESSKFSALWKTRVG